jgi:hypothetical protein
MSQYSYYLGSGTTVYQTGANTTATLYQTGGGDSAVGPLPTPPREVDPISWLKARVQETIDAVKWPSAA